MCYNITWPLPLFSQGREERVGSNPVSSSSYFLRDYNLPWNQKLNTLRGSKEPEAYPLTRSSSYPSHGKYVWDGADVLGGHESYFHTPDSLYHRGMCMNKAHGRL